MSRVPDHDWVRTVSDEAVEPEQVETAMETLIDMIRAEYDDGHKRELFDVFTTLTGVYDLELSREDIPDEDLRTLQHVLESVDLDTQYYTESEAVTKSLNRGVEWVELMKTDDTGSEP
jgi:hypothetical protein